jgi:membrane associated rhomboid family serine protease
VLVAHQEPLAVLEIPEQGTGIVVLDEAGASPEELRLRLERVFAAHQTGVLIVVITGGSPELRPVLEQADREAHARDRLGIYHLDRTGQLVHVAGRSLKLLERADLAAVTPFSPADAPALIERGRREREEAVRFAEQLRGRFPHVTAAVIALCVALYGLATQWGQGNVQNVAVAMGSNGGTLVRQGQVWRLLSHAFLHGSGVHLVMNMIGVYSFGGFLERIIGWRRFLVLYGLSALGGGVASALVANHENSVGASGALWGLMLAGFALFQQRQTAVPPRIAAGLRQQLLVVLVINTLLSFTGGIDFSAHLGGGVVGYLLMRTDLLRERPALRLVAPLVGLMLAVSVALALATGRPWAQDLAPFG